MVTGREVTHELSDMIFHSPGPTWPEPLLSLNCLSICLPCWECFCPNSSMGLQNAFSIHMTFPQHCSGPGQSLHSNRLKLIDFTNIIKFNCCLKQLIWQMVEWPLKDSVSTSLGVIICGAGAVSSRM